jgi:hypothetical protein
VSAVSNRAVSGESGTVARAEADLGVRLNGENSYPLPAVAKRTLSADPTDSSEPRYASLVSFKLPRELLSTPTDTRAADSPSPTS